MAKVVIFGNSGSGKSTLALRMSTDAGLSHLDLDTLAWQATKPPQRKPLQESELEIIAFAQSHEDWVIEGCYADLIALAMPFASQLMFLDLSVEDCIAHAYARPFEPHKYASKKAQDANLNMLVDWIKDYPERDDVCSRAAHSALYEVFAGKKARITTPTDPLLQAAVDN
ncbi:shikimate kinase [Congregibacter variabilis]|uniref:Shikimate kinase n=1 Tax=Congregibacter variabilis TaxID=3081200 RepID=A0ABZ0I2F8_9GAMM|nr:shikimate kinase [Congregibacter sp. IMCC43200]